MSDLAVPNAFTSGTSIVAADMNANFDAIETLVNTTGVPKLQAESVTPSNLDRPEIGLVRLTSSLPDDADGSTDLTGSGIPWTSVISSPGAHLAFDGTDLCFKAVTAGLFRLTAMVVSDESIVAMSRVNATVVDAGATALRSYTSKIVSLAAGDKFKPYVVSSGTATITASATTGTWMQAEYLGPAT